MGRARGDRHLPRREGQRALRALPHRRRPLDDPPDGSPQDPDREPMPEQLAPMLATSSEVLPSDDGRWGYEIKWDGVRMIAFVAGGTVKLQGRRLLDATARYPEIRSIADVVSSHEVVLDGEVVALDDAGRPDFGKLQQRMNVAEGAALRRVARDVPVVYMLFDLLYLDGHQTVGLPYTERRRMLESLSLAGPSWQTPSYHVGDGAALLDATRARGLEGLVAKRLDSVYRPGRRSASVDQGQERQPPGAGGRGVAERPGRADRAARRSPRRVLRRRRSALCRPGGERLHRPGARPPRRAAGASRPVHEPVHSAARPTGRGGQAGSLRRAHPGGGGGLQRVDPPGHAAGPPLQGLARRHRSSRRGARGGPGSPESVEDEG